MNRRQILVLGLVLVIITAGVLQYNLGQSSYSSTEGVDERLGEAVYVDNLDTTGEQAIEDQEANESESSVTSEDTEQEASSAVNDYFTQAKLEREASRSKQQEELKGITTDASSDKETKSKAYEEMMGLVNRSDIEMKIESLIKQRGFKDSLVYFGDDGSIDLIVKASSLTPAQTAQISDIVSRHANVQIEDIHIKNMY